MAPAEDADIVQALAAIGAEAVSLERLGERVLPSGRAAFRVATRDGRVLKARRATRAENAAKTATMARALVGVRAVSVLAKAGKVTIESWVAGQPLVDLEVAEERAGEAADLLAAVHATEWVDGSPFPREAGTALVVDQLDRRLSRLRERGALTDGEAAALVARARAAVPLRAATGMSHEDFCGENLVVDEHGELWIVDLGALDVGFLDFDLARTRIRWPMPQRTWTVFLERYRRSRPGALPAEHEPFWLIAAGVKSAHHRLHFGLDAALPPLANLAARLGMLS